MLLFKSKCWSVSLPTVFEWDFQTLFHCRPTIQRGSLSNDGTDIYTMSTLGFTSPFKLPHSLGSSVRDFFSTKTTNGHFYNLLTCANLCQKPLSSWVCSHVLSWTRSQLSALRFSSTLSSMEIVNKQRGTYEQFLGRNFIGLIALGIEIRGAWVIYVALQQALPQL